jgi:hypothetical protein
MEPAPIKDLVTIGDLGYEDGIAPALAVPERAAPPDTRAG